MRLLDRSLARKRVKKEKWRPKKKRSMMVMIISAIVKIKTLLPCNSRRSFGKN